LAVEYHKDKSKQTAIIVILRINSINKFLAKDAVVLILDVSIMSYIKIFEQSGLSMIL
jgi:hypothetical protein